MSMSPYSAAAAQLNKRPPSGCTLTFESVGRLQGTSCPCSTPVGGTSERSPCGRPSGTLKQWLYLDVKLNGTNCPLARDHGVLSRTSSLARPLCRYPPTR